MDRGTTLSLRSPFDWLRALSRAERQCGYPVALLENCRNDLKWPRG